MYACQAYLECVVRLSRAEGFYFRSVFRQFPLKRNRFELSISRTKAHTFRGQCQSGKRHERTARLIVMGWSELFHTFLWYRTFRLLSLYHLEAAHVWIKDGVGGKPYQERHHRIYAPLHCPSKGSLLYLLIYSIVFLSS